MAADPENHADRAEHEQDHRRHQERALAYALPRRGKGVLDALGEAPPVLGLMAVGLHRANLVQGLVEIGADVADAILARARELAHTATEQHDGQNDDRHTQQHEKGQLEARERQHHQPADQQQHIAHRHRCARADHRFQHSRVVGEPRYHLAGARELEIRRRQQQQVLEHAHGACPAITRSPSHDTK